MIMANKNDDLSLLGQKLSACTCWELCVAIMKSYAAKLLVRRRPMLVFCHVILCTWTFQKKSPPLRNCTIGTNGYLTYPVRIVFWHVLIIVRKNFNGLEVLIQSKRINSKGKNSLKGFSFTERVISLWLDVILTLEAQWMSPIVFVFSMQVTCGAVRR